MATSNEPKAAPDKSAAEYQSAGQKAADKQTGTGSDRGARGRDATVSDRAGRTGGGADAAPGSGVGEQIRRDHEARVTVPGAGNVDARLDNRRGADRPPLEEWPAKPQQIDGPDVMGQVEHTRRTLADRDDDEGAVGKRKGMFSPGPHGLSDVSERGDRSPEDVDKANEEAAGQPTAD